MLDKCWTAGDASSYPVEYETKSDLIARSRLSRTTDDRTGPPGLARFGPQNPMQPDQPRLSPPDARHSVASMSRIPTRDEILRGGDVDGRGWLAAGRAAEVRAGTCPFLAQRGIASELEDKRRAIASGELRFHTQIGWRSAQASIRGAAEIHDRLAAHGWAPDRYGICLDWSMGLPPARRSAGRRGTGMILGEPDFAALANATPVAPHFGDFVLGMPGARENAAAAVRAGSTTIGNLAQYFTFRLPGWNDDVETTRATVEALGMLAAQPAEMLIHSNLDDGYAAWFRDIGTTLGFAMIERRIVEELIGLPLGHCYGHTYTDPVKRMAFKIALAGANPTPGTMLYGNTTLYRAEAAGNYGALAGYLVIDIAGQLLAPTGHAVTPIPVTEAARIPTPEEVVDAQMAARRLAGRVGEMLPLIDPGPAEEMAAAITARGEAFRDRALDGLAGAGFDIDDPGELMLALRRIGPARLEALWGDPADPVTSPHVDELAAMASRIVEGRAPSRRRRGPLVLVACTDVHFYGKELLEAVLDRLGLDRIDGGVSAEPADIARQAAEAGANAVAISTYNGVALSFARDLRAALAEAGREVPVFIGGRLNEIFDEAGEPLPVEVDAELRQSGARPCATVEEFLDALEELA